MNRNTGYDFAQKENWRNRVWNQLADRVKVRPSEATVLYLAAEDDLDFEPARRRGFHSANLIAINNDMKVVEHLRAKGRLAIHGDALTVVASWPTDRRIHGLNLDYCGGATGERFNDTAAMLYCAHMEQCAISVNMLRGREFDWREFGGDWQNVKPFKIHSADPKHRGSLFVTFLCFHVANEYVRASGVRFTVERIQKFFLEVVTRMKPVCFGYPSGPLKMDTLVFNNPIEGHNGGVHYASPAMRRQISAVLAHQTRRLSQRNAA